MLGSPAATPWFLATVVLSGMTFMFLLLIIFLAKRTNGFIELKASLTGQRICLFFDDTRTFEMKSKKPSAGIISDDIYGDYIINEKGTYVDKRTRNIMIPFSSTVAVGGEVKHFQAADELSKMLNDEKQLQEIALKLANGQLEDTRFDALKTSINFSSLKSFSNTITPHNIAAKINMEIARRMKSYGNVNGKQILIYILLVIGAVGLMAIVLYLVMGNKGGSPTIITQTAQTLGQNLTQPGAILVG